MLRIEPAGLFISSIFVLIGIAFVYVWETIAERQQRRRRHRHT